MPNRLEEVLDEARRLVELTRKDAEKIERIAAELEGRVREAAKDEPDIHSVELGGSFAKGTWLKGDVDIDVFVKFSESLSKKELEEAGVRIGRRALEPYLHFLRYSEHPYVEGVIDGVRVDIVACFDVEKGSWKSAADRSPFHTEYVKENFTESLKSEARLLKKFLKGIGIYGAEVKIQGFSGYVCEVLTLKFGSFTSVLEAASSFKEREVVSIGRIDEEDLKRFNSYLIIPDPIDSRRNLGAAISPENAATLTLASRKFLADPNVKQFMGPEVKETYAELETQPLVDRLLIVTFNHTPRMVDIVWGQLKRSEAALSKQLSTAGFRLLRSSSASDEESQSGFVFLLESLELPRLQLKIGPKVGMKDDASKFLDRNRATSKALWVGGDGRIYALVDRRYWRAEDLMEKLLSGAEPSSGVAPGLKSDIEGGFKVYSGRDALNALTGRRWLAEEVSKVVGTDEFAFGPG